MASPSRLVTWTKGREKLAWSLYECFLLMKNFEHFYFYYFYFIIRFVLSANFCLVQLEILLLIWTIIYKVPHVGGRSDPMSLSYFIRYTLLMPCFSPAQCHIIQGYSVL